MLVWKGCAAQHISHRVKVRAGAALHASSSAGLEHRRVPHARIGICMLSKRQLKECEVGQAC